MNDDRDLKDILRRLEQLETEMNKLRNGAAAQSSTTHVIETKIEGLIDRQKEWRQDDLRWRDTLVVWFRWIIGSLIVLGTAFAVHWAAPTAFRLTP